MTTQNIGVSKRSLLLLGGLTAALTNPVARQKFLQAMGSASENVQAAALEAGVAYQETVKPLARQASHSVAVRAQELAHLATERGSELAHLAAERGTELAHTANELAHTATERGSELAARGSVVAVRGSKAAAGLVSELRESGGKQAQSLLHSAHDTAAALARKDGGKVVAQKVREGRRSALKLQNELSREVSVRGAKLEKVSGKKLRAAQKELDRHAKQLRREVRRESGSGGVSGVLITLLLLVGGGVVLARVPRVRHAILKAVGSVSPEAADALHSAGTSVRDIVGSVWMERIEPETATQAPAPKPSLATGSAAYGSTEPGSPAQATPPQNTLAQAPEAPASGAEARSPAPQDESAQSAQPPVNKGKASEKNPKN